MALVLLGDALVAVGYYIVFSRAAGEQLGCQHYRSAAGPECHRSLRHRSPSNVFGRSIDDSFHAVGLGLALGLHVRAVLLCGIIAARLLDEERISRRTCQVKPDWRIRDGCPLDELGLFFDYTWLWPLIFAFSR